MTSPKRVPGKFGRAVVAQNGPHPRCSLESGQIYDPCLVVDEKQTIVCGADPTTNESGFRLNLTNALPEANVTADAGNKAWFIQLADGTTCSFATDATLGFDEKRVNYNCSDESNILGDLQAGDVWRAERIMVGRSDEGFFIQESQMVPIATLWEAAEPSSGVAPAEPAGTEVEAIAVNPQTDASTEAASTEAQPEVANMKVAISIAPEQVTVNVAGFANSVQGKIKPAGPYDANTPPTEYSWPTHLRFTFDDERLSD